MKKTFLTLVGVVCLVMEVFCAGKGSDPVAAAFPDWQGLNDKNHITGRQLTPSDLRHKITIIFEFEYTTELQKQLVAAAPLALAMGYDAMENGGWETLESLPRNVIFVAVNRGEKSPEEIKAALKPAKDADEATKKALKLIDNETVAFYDGVGFAEEPDNNKRLPFVYVMGVQGKEALYSGKFDDGCVSAALNAISQEKARLATEMYNWKPFYGSMIKPQYFGDIVAKALETGKPMKPALAVLKKEILNKDADKANEAQMICDAIEQVRSDLLLRIKLEALACPHRACYDAKQLIKWWPVDKKRLVPILAKVRAQPDVEKLVTIYNKCMTYGDANFVCKNAADAKKIVAELNKMKKDLDKMKDSKIPAVQKGALFLGSQLEMLISSVPSKVPQK